MTESLTVQQLGELPGDSVIEVTARGSISDSYIIIGCNRIPIPVILGAGGTVSGADGGLTVAASLRKADAGWWHLDAARRWTSIDVVAYATQVTLKERGNPERPNDLLDAEVIPGLYMCTAHPSEHFYFLMANGRWAILSLESGHGNAQEFPRFSCDLRQGATLSYMTNSRGGSVSHVQTKIRRKHLDQCGTGAYAPRLRTDEH